MRLSSFDTVTTAEQAVDRLIALYDAAIDAQRHALERFFRNSTWRPRPKNERNSATRSSGLATGRRRSRRSSSEPMPSFRDRVSTRRPSPSPPSSGTICWSSSTTSCGDYGATIEVGVSDQEIPYPYVFERGDELGRGAHSAAELAQFISRRRSSRRSATRLPMGPGSSGRRAASPVAVRRGADRLFAAAARALHGHRLALRPAVDPAHQLSPLCRPVRALGDLGARRREQPV